MHHAPTAQHAPDQQELALPELDRHLQELARPELLPQEHGGSLDIQRRLHVAEPAPGQDLKGHMCGPQKENATSVLQLKLLFKKSSKGQGTPGKVWAWQSFPCSWYAFWWHGMPPALPCERGPMHTAAAGGCGMQVQVRAQQHAVAAPAAPQVRCSHTP
jgi:hypothetical protein